MTRFLCVALLSFASWQTCLAEELPPVSEVPERNQLLGDLAGIIARSIVRTDTTHAVFHGCYDWHSSVHGHWALVRVARVTGGHQEKRSLSSVRCLRRGLPGKRNTSAGTRTSKCLTGEPGS